MTTLQIRGYTDEEAERWIAALNEAKGLDKYDYYLTFDSESISEIPDSIGMLWTQQALIEEQVDLLPADPKLQ
jgi:hypothetical protein